MTVAGPDIRRPRLLIVDDQPANVRVLAEALRPDYECSFATSGARALEMARAGDFDLILLDVVMPDLGGFEVCRRLKADERIAATPVIFVTASEEIEDETQGFEVGGVDYITKPIQPQTVRARVRTHIELKHARDLLAQLAWLDGLTGIPNRRRFDLALEAEWQRASRGGRVLSVALVDVDHFKRFNDSYGHAKGDECLRAVARALRSTVQRPGDLVARVGGEEFAVLMPETDGEGMQLLVQALLHAVAELQVPHQGSTHGVVTVSIGAVTLVPERDQPPGSALETADRLLYEVKEGGRAHAQHLDLIRNGRTRVGPRVIPSLGEVLP